MTGYFVQTVTDSTFKKTYSKLVPLTGTVTEKGEGGLADATVRVGNKSAKTRWKW